MNTKERNEFFQARNNAFKRGMHISFHSFGEMTRLAQEQKFKITQRNQLGIKSDKNEDWIFSFNIGNIMHLQAVTFDELEFKLPTTSAVLNFSKNETIITGETSKDNSFSPLI